MHYYERSTQVPNEIFDQHLPYLNQTQLKVLLVVIRQTLGWVNPKTKQRKRKDWISISFFSKRTRLTHKSISMAISALIYKELIVALDDSERELRHPKDRRGKRRIYYAYAPYYSVLKKQTCVDTLTDLFTFPPYTKQTQTKENNTATKNTSHRQTDVQRYQEILKRPQKKTNT
jgi:DNA-binding transcriptional ArsR family regulator